MELVTGKLLTPERVVLYGVAGIGKSTLASHFPRPVFIDVEGSTARMDVARTPTPQSWTQVLQQVQSLTNDMQGHHTLVIDTADWAEKLGIAQLCAKLGISGLGEGPGGKEDYGRTRNAWASEWGKLLDALTHLTERTGAHVVLLAHARVRKQELPEEFGAYDHWELNLERNTAALTTAWATLVLFANYRTLIVQDEKTKTKHAEGGERMLYSQRHACWDAKQRPGMDLDAAMPLDYGRLAHLFPVLTKAPVAPPAEAPGPVADVGHMSALDALHSLMGQDSITTEQVQWVCLKYYPVGTPLENMTTEFITGYLIPKWEIAVKKIRSEYNG